MVHELKTLPQYFKAVVSGEKTFEIRKDDRGFEVGDILILKEYNQGLTDSTGSEKVVIQEQGYTGKETRKTITYILKGGKYGLHQGYVILALGEYIEKGNITDEEIDTFGKFTNEQKKIIKKEYAKYPKGFFPNPMCALY